jgi:hypothetical protein
LAESKNGAVVRKHMGYTHITAPHAAAIAGFFQEHLTAFSHRQAEGARSRANRSGVMAAFCEKRKIVIS